VKVVLGFLELALALKFLSIADQAYHWGILDREIYLAFWIVIFALIGVYLLGKIRLPHDSVVDSVGIPRVLMAIVTFAFVVYMIPGMWGAPLKGLSGYLPPLTTQDFQPNPNSGSVGVKKENTLCDSPLYAEKLHFPHGLQGYFDYKQAMACAKQQNKPVFIDFTGHGCVNCREMEANVWSDPKVLEKLNNDFIVLALYVDDKTELPEALWYKSAYDGREKKTIGKQNADRQVTQFKNNAQPYYILLSPDEKLLAVPKAYDLNPQNFEAFLEDGIQRFKQGGSLVLPD
jgi:thiol:disulfide interchange protein DsbD